MVGFILCIMPISQALHRIGRGFRRGLHLVARPVNRAARSGPLLVQPYRGYGSEDEVYLMGRIFHQPQFGERLRPGTILRDGVDVLRRFARWGVSDAKIIARFAGTETVLRSDRDGYFHVHMQLGHPPPRGMMWHVVELEVRALDTVVHEKAKVFIPPKEARFVVVSDIDDTVMFTGVVNKALMMWRLFVQGAESRVAFPGVGALYRALHDGPSEEGVNPMLYVSRGPWSIYEVLDRFFNLHDIPVGPVLFLREWGLTLQRPLPRRASGHKHDLIREMLERYDRLPFVLIGDSGQHDPEIYAEIVRMHPDRIRAVYIRNVSRKRSRIREIEALAEEVAEAGAHLVLASDSFAMAEHAAEIGLIDETARDAVLRERIEEEEEGGGAGPRPTKRIGAGARPVAERVREEVEPDPAGDRTPQTVVVRPDADE